MTLCSSGSLSILGTAGTNRSIGCEVDGNVTPPKNLCTLSVDAGKSPPHSMLEFYGYSSSVDIYLDITQDTDTAGAKGFYGVFNPTGMTSGCYCVCVGMRTVMGPSGIKCAARACVIKNGICIGGVITTTLATICNCSISFVQDYNDNTCLCVRAANLSGTATATACITSITDIVGSYNLGTPNCICAYIST